MSTSKYALGSSQEIKQSKSPRVRKQMSLKHRFKNWLRRWINEEEQKEQIRSSALVESSELDSHAPMRITIHRAAGGLIIDTRTYDRVKDRNNQNLHIITHEQDLAESLSKIITMETLRA